MESKVGRMGSSFYVLLTAGDDATAPESRLAFLWQRELFQDIPNTPPAQRLEFYEAWPNPKWPSLFHGHCDTVEQSTERLRELLREGEVLLGRLFKTPMAEMRMRIYDGKQIEIKTPPETAEVATIDPDLGIKLAKSLVWSNMITKEVK